MDDHHFRLVTKLKKNPLLQTHRKTIQMIVACVLCIVPQIRKTKHWKCKPSEVGQF
jgi:hypothetical protein